MGKDGMTRQERRKRNKRLHTERRGEAQRRMAAGRRENVGEPRWKREQRNKAIWDDVVNRGGTASEDSDSE